MNNEIIYRIENKDLILDYYFDNKKISSTNAGCIIDILNQVKLYNEEYNTLIEQNKQMIDIAKNYEQLQQENQQLKEKITLRNKEKTDICNKIQNQREKNKRHRIAITNLITKNKQLKEKIKGFENPITYFNYANKTLKDENIQLRTEISAREGKYEKLEDNWNELKELIDVKLYNTEYLQKLCGCRIDDVNHLILKIIKNKIIELERGESDVED